MDIYKFGRDPTINMLKDNKVFYLNRIKNDVNISNINLRKKR